MTDFSILPAKKHGIFTLADGYGDCKGGMAGDSTPLRGLLHAGSPAMLDVTVPDDFACPKCGAGKDDFSPEM